MVGSIPISSGAPANLDVHSLEVLDATHHKALRDVAEGNGRCDYIPLSSVIKTAVVVATALCVGLEKNPSKQQWDDRVSAANEASCQLRFQLCGSEPITNATCLTIFQSMDPYPAVLAESKDFAYWHMLPSMIVGALVNPLVLMMNSIEENKYRQANWSYYAEPVCARLSGLALGVGMIVLAKGKIDEGVKATASMLIVSATMHIFHGLVGIQNVVNMQESLHNRLKILHSQLKRLVS